MVAVIFGSTGGIAHAVSHLFWEKGYDLALFSTSQLTYEDDCVLARAGDASLESDVREFLSDVEKKFGSIGVVVFAVGSPVTDLPSSHRANVVTLYNVLEAMGQKSATPIFVIGSLRSGTPGRNVAYCVSKAGVEMAVACEKKRFPHLNVTLLRLGFTNTPLYKEESQLPFT